MARYNQPLKFSVNTSIINKIHPADKSLLSSGFQLVEGTIEELAEVITEEGWAFSYVFDNNVRKKSHFLSADLLPVDIDGGFNLHEIMKDPLVEQYCSLIYTTPSHSVDHHRYRLVFVLPQTITNPQDLSAASKSLARRLGGDMAATDSARLFYGSKGAQTWLFDREISADFLEELIEDGKTKTNNDSIVNNNKTTNRSRFSPKSTKTVILADNSEVELKDIKKNTSIYCPFHKDQSPSAFVAITDKGSQYIRCSSCELTWWIDGNMAGYDFNAFVSALKNLKLKASKTYFQPDGPLSLIFNEMLIKQPNIKFTSSQFFQCQELNEGITFIRSPKGSGKTKFLSDFMKSIFHPHAKLSLEEYEEATDFSFDIPLDSETKVLLIGHRQALIGDLSTKLKLNCYLDDKKQSTGLIKERQKRYAVCVDSLKKVETLDYDIVVIDEVEQVLSHFLSETLGEKRTKIFEILSEKVNKAKIVIVLDADIGWVSFTTLSQLAPKKEIFVYVNEYQQQGRSLNLYQKESHITSDLMSDIASGKRVFVTSNSKTKIKILEKAIEKFSQDNQLELNMMVITAENSSNKKIQYFIQNISKQILEYDVILSSPSLGTGIDISFDNQQQEIDVVYGIFENLINSHFEIDQQLARVRRPGEVKVWISPRTFNFETDFDVVTEDFLLDQLHETVLLRKQYQFDDLEPFIRMVGMITAEQRASKNNLKQNFIDLKLEQGWSVIPVEIEVDLVELGKQFLRDGRKLNDLEYTKRLINAETMNQYHFYRFKKANEMNDSEITPASRDSYHRTNMELFYRKTIDEELIATDKRGRFSRQIRQFERLINSSNFMRNMDNINNLIPTKYEINKYLKNASQGTILMSELLSATPVFKDGKFDVNAVFTRNDLAKFTKVVIDMKSEAETHFGITTKSDVNKKPVEHLSSLLKLLGLKLIQPTTPTTKNGVKTYYYALCPDSLKTVVEIVERRQQINAWEFVEQTYGFTYSAFEEEWLDTHLNPTY